MASYYPTPPPTGSPKHSHDQFNTRPAQETYFQQSYSTPASPNHWDASPAARPISQNNAAPEYLPPRRKSSPIQPTYSQTQPQPKPTFTGSYEARPSFAQNRPYSPPRKHSKSPPPRPLHFSPTNPIPSPYNVNRPAPRPGFVKRMLAKLSANLRKFIKWCRHNPVKAGLLALLPFLAGAAMIKVLRLLGIGNLLKSLPGIANLGKAAAAVGSGIIEGMGGSKSPRAKNEEADAKARDEEDKKKTAAAAANSEWGYGLDEFIGFGGTKAGPLDGFLKVMHMGVTHWCKLSPSSIPRAASVLLDIYFLDASRRDDTALSFPGIPDAADRDAK